MYFRLLLDLAGNMALIIVFAYLIGRSRYIANCANRPLNWRPWLILTSIFSLLSILGTYNGFEVEGALANTRLVGTLMGGIMGGPFVGLSVGIISGLQRILMGGFTAEMCGLSTVLGGLIAGLVRHKIGLYNMSWKTAGFLALIAECLQKALVLLFSKPFAAAWALEQTIALPTTLVSIFGTIAFMFIIKDIQHREKQQAANAADLALEIASKTLPHLRQGLNQNSATETARIIYALTKVDAVAITDCSLVLAFVGKGTDHHKAGEPIITQSTKQAIKDGCLSVLYTNHDRGCPVPNCPLNSGVVAPLISHGTIVGTIKLSRANAGEVSPIDIKLANGIAQLLSVQIELAEIDAQRKMRERAELKALRAQINPHFLFNTLAIIISFCRTAPETARNLLLHLSTILHYSFANHGDLVTVAEELNEIDAYLEIAKARFGSRLSVSLQIDEAVLSAKIPVLSIQPLVENALNHGLFPKLTAAQLHISASIIEHNVIIIIKDNGVGIPESKMHTLFSTAADTGVGLQNIACRLKTIYGEPYGLSLSSVVNKGTTATIRIPYLKELTECAS